MGKHTYFTFEQEVWLRENYHLMSSYSMLTDRFNSKFGTSRNIGMIRDKCSKRMGLKGMPNQTRYGKKKKEELPLGTIKKSQTGTYIKVRMSNGAKCAWYTEPYWLPLQKKIYQDAYGDILPEQMVCFLDGNPNNFNLDNLYPIDRKISAVMSSNKWWTSDKERTLTAIKWCELFYALKELENINIKEK